MNLAVDVISDVICPWCYIGKRRLEKAIAALDDQHDVEVRWHPFFIINNAITLSGAQAPETFLAAFKQATT